MKKQSTKTHDLIIYKKWKLELSLDKGLINYNLINNRLQNSDVKYFDVINRELKPYFIKSNRKIKKFVTSFYDVPLIEKDEVIKHKLTQDIESQVTGISEEAYRNQTLMSLISKITYSVVAIQIQRNNSRLLKLSKELHSRWNIPVGVNAYFTPRMSQTLPLHFDNHEVFILQIYGTKKWQVLDADTKIKGKAKVLIDKVLTPGDMLFIPMGYYHQAVSEDETSFHMTFGLHGFPELIIKEWLERRYGFKKRKISKKQLSFYNSLYFFFRFPDNFKDSPYLIFENKNENKIIIFIEGHEIHLDKKYKKELKALLSGRDVESKPMIRMKKIFLKEKIICTN